MIKDYNSAKQRGTGTGSTMARTNQTARKTTNPPSVNDSRFTSHSSTSTSSTGISTSTGASKKAKVEKVEVDWEASGLF